jgi:rfaE bifunctional protein kinase chain/domain
MGINASRARSIFADVRGKTILTLGDFFGDGYTTGGVERINPESSVVPLLRVKGRRTSVSYRSGGAGNVARNIASLGASSTLVSVCGDDDLSRTLQQVACKEGYQTRLIHDKARNTIEKHRFVSPDGGLLRVDFEDDKDVVPLCTEIAERLISQIKFEVKRADAVIVSDYNKGIIGALNVDDLLDVVKGKLLLVDAKPNNLPRFLGADMIAPNRAEAIASLHATGNETLPELASTLSKRIGAEVFLTASADGICIADRETYLTQMVPQCHVEHVKDTSGCGDTAAAMIMLAKLVGATSVEAAELANAAAAVVVNEVGAYAPTPEQVIRKLVS